MMSKKKRTFLLIIAIGFILSFAAYYHLLNSSLKMKKGEYVGLSPIIFNLEKIKLYLENDNSQDSNIFEKYFSLSNISNSKQIEPYRDIPDTRHPNCQEKFYNLKNKKVSIIITFYNEVRSVLLRTIVSILQRTPRNFLSEIVVIDDFSKNETDGEGLKFLPLVKVIRNIKQEGLIKSRNIGAEIAIGDYLIFLDSQCEVNVGWLEPLLARLSNNDGVAVSPVIDSIDVKSFEYKASSVNLRGGFDWNLHFRWIPIPKEEQESKNDPSEPFISPTFAGGVFAISRKWFFKMGGFNPLLSASIWGGESLEMSLKIWLCGGQIEIAPCSRVGHIYNENLIFSSPEQKHNTYLSNSKVLAETWLDEYKNIFYYLNSDAINVSLGRTNELKVLKKELQCRPFVWYLQNVFQELMIEGRKFGLPEQSIVAFGKLKCGEKCLDARFLNKHNKRISLENCNNDEVTQWILYARTGKLIANFNDCLNVNGNVVVLEACKNNNNTMEMKQWIRDGGHIIHYETGSCLQNIFNKRIGVGSCKRGDPSQLFSFSVEFQVL